MLLDIPARALFGVWRAAASPVICVSWQPVVKAKDALRGKSNSSLIHSPAIFLDHCKRRDRAMDRAPSLLLNDRCPMPYGCIHDHLANLQFDQTTSAKLAVDR